MEVENGRLKSSSRPPFSISMIWEKGTIQWLFLVPINCGRWHSPSPNWQEKYHWIIPLIVLAEPGGLYDATDPTLYRNLKNPLINVCHGQGCRYIGDGHPTFNRNPYNGAL